MRTLDKRIELLKKYQAEMDHRTEVENEAVKLMGEGQFKKAEELLRTLDDNIITELQRELEELSDPELETEEQETETSAFDEYDEENGYNEDIKVLNIWAVCKENIDRIVKLCVRAFNDSYTKCMEADIMSLLDYLKFEISTINET